MGVYDGEIEEQEFARMTKSYDKTHAFQIFNVPYRNAEVLHQPYTQKYMRKHFVATYIGIHLRKIYLTQNNDYRLNPVVNVFQGFAARFAAVYQQTI